MKVLDIARKLANAGEHKEATKAYQLVINENDGNNNDIDLEAAMYLLYEDCDYRIPVTMLVKLHKKGYMKNDIVQLLFSVLWQSNYSIFKENYRSNLAKLKNYKYIFKSKENFPEFEDLDVLFLPFGENTFIPYDQRNDQFGEACKIRQEEIKHYFFKDLSKPVFAEDIYSQYELEYVYDQVRESEHCGKENHIYLYYSDFKKFSSFLQILDLKYITRKDKIVFLFEKEKSMYPIDFKEKYGIDYTLFEPREVKAEDISKLIYHQQYSSHNGGDFFNEIFDAHPCLCTAPSKMYENFVETYKKYNDMDEEHELIVKFLGEKEFGIRKKVHINSEKENAHYFITNLFLQSNILNNGSYACSRIFPAIFIQPHFSNIISESKFINEKTAVTTNNEHKIIESSIFFKGMKYIKTFEPIRKPIRSYGATMKFFHNENFNSKEKELIMANEILYILENKNYMYSKNNRIYNDSRLVKFEDAKLHPEIIFKNLAQFLDVPYTDSMKHCSEYGIKDPESLEGNDIGFSKAALNRTYEEYIGFNEGILIECAIRGFYEQYNYKFDYYKDKNYSLEKLDSLVNELNKYFSIIKKFNQKKHNDDVNKKEIFVGGKLHRGVSTDKTFGDTLAGCYKNEILNYLHATYDKNINYIDKFGENLEYIKLIDAD